MMKSDNQSSDSFPNSEPNTVEISSDISDVRYIDGPVILIFWTLFGIILMQFFTRYVMNDSLAWTEEIARYLLIFLCFVGSVTCVRKGSHIFIEFFYRYLPAKGIKILSIVSEIVSIAFYLSLGYFAIELVNRTHAQKMVSIELPKSVIYWVVVISCFAMGLISIWNGIQLVRTSGKEIANRKFDL